jgi:hypothetical protein
MAQEFIDEYGEYDELPKIAARKETIRVSGEITAPVEFGGVGIARIDRAKPLEPEYLNTTSTYRIPEPYVLYFPTGFKTPKPVQLDGRRFSIDVALDDAARPGRYQVSIWGKYPGAGKELVMVSLRTIDVK